MGNEIAAAAANTLAVGRWTLNLFSMTTLTGIKEVTADPESDEQEVFHQGAGDTPLLWQSKEKWSVSVTVEGGNIATIAALHNITLGAAGQYGLCHGTPGTISGWLERRIYDEEMNTVLASHILHDLIPRNLSIQGPMDRAEIEVPLVTYQKPYTLKDVAEGTKYPIGFYETYSGDAETVEFTLTHTPLVIDKTNLNNQYALFVKVDSVRQTSGITITPGGPTLTFTVAPATGTNNIEILYVYDLEE